MQPQPISTPDCSRLSELQPQDWPEIGPVFAWYHETAWTQAVKIELEGKIVGVGAGIMYRSTAWIAHIITHPDYRRRGIGGSIVRYLVDSLQAEGCRSICLFATESGAPLYARYGFRTITEYSFFRSESDAPPAASRPPSEQGLVRSANPADHRAILQLDEQISGEGRAALLRDYLDSALVCEESGEITGYFLPSLLEGPIIAASESAGTALLTRKAQTHCRITVPSENRAATNLMSQLGWSEAFRARRMQLGEPPALQLQGIYSRIGGNLG